MALEIVVKYTGTVHGLVHRETGDVPTTEDEVIGMHHREDVRDRKTRISFPLPGSVPMDTVEARRTELM